MRTGRTRINDEEWVKSRERELKEGKERGDEVEMERNRGEMRDEVKYSERGRGVRKERMWKKKRENMGIERHMERWREREREYIQYERK